MAYPVVIIGLLSVFLFCFEKFWSQWSWSRAKPRGCRRLGLPKGVLSNIYDEYDYDVRGGFNPRKLSHNDHQEEGSKIRVKALFSYPIKSCAGVEFDTADVIVTGFKYDRLFCFAEDVSFKTNNNSNNKDNGTTTAEQNQGRAEQRQDSNWEFRSMRNGEFSKLALVKPEIWIPDPMAGDYHPELEEVRSGGVMVVSYPRVLPSNFFKRSIIRSAITLGLCPPICSFRVPLTPGAGHNYPSVLVKIWKDRPSAFDYGCHLPDSLHRLLNISPSSNEKGGERPRFTLLRSDPNSTREIYRNAPRKAQLGFQARTGFADAYPIHLLNVASVRDIEQKCAKGISKLTLRRFRANIILEGPAAYDEDMWKKILVRPRQRQQEQKQVTKMTTATTISPSTGTPDEGDGNRDSKGIIIYTVCHTVRCLLPNVDPDTGVRHSSEPNKALKTYRKIDLGDPKNACMGMQCVPGMEEFTLSVGDEVCVLETGEHFYIKMNSPNDPEV